MDLRRRIVAAWKKQEGTWDELAARFGVGIATVNRLVARQRRTGSLEPTQQKYGADPKLDDAGVRAVEQWLKAKPDVTLPELVEMAKDRLGVTVSRATMGRVVSERLGFTRKKRPSSRRSVSARR